MTTLKIGSKEVNVEDFRNDWALALMSRGVIVDLRIGIWRGRARLQAEDLGLQFVDNEAQEFMSKYIVLGSEKLLPAQINKEMSMIESAGRKCLERHSFDTVWGKFVPFHAFDSWANENEIVKRQFNDYVIQFCNKYNEIVDIIAIEYQKMARDVWKRTHPNSSSAPEPFVSEFVNKVKAKIPPQSQMPSFFHYDEIFFNIPLPSVIQENVAAAKKVEVDTTNKLFEADLERRTKQRIADEYLAKKKDLIDGFLNATVSSMRKYVEDLCGEVLEAIGKNNVKDLSLKQQEKIVAMIDKVKMLNFYNDSEIEKLLNELRFEAMKVKGERNKDTIIDKLQRIVSVASEEFTPPDFNPTIDYLEI